MCGGDAAFCQITLTTCWFGAIFVEVIYSPDNSPDGASPVVTGLAPWVFRLLVQE